MFSKNSHSQRIKPRSGFGERRRWMESLVELRTFVLHALSQVRKANSRHSVLPNQASFSKKADKEFKKMAKLADMSTSMTDHRTDH